MFPALRSNGIARWLAMVLALFGLAAAMLLSVALSLGSARGGATTAATLDAAQGPSAPAALRAGPEEVSAARREPTPR